MPPPAKRQKKNEDDLICPINLSLPLDPVVAEDGRIYEREAIEKYIKNNRGQELLSPITREKMGNKLIAALPTKNHIETLIENGAIAGEPAEDWKKRMKEKKKNEDLVKKAEEGDVGAMERVATYYYFGRNSFKKDEKMAYKWFEKARVAGSIYGLANVGVFLVHGYGVERNTAKGMLFLGMAQGQGSDLAAYCLGYLMVHGCHGVPVDKVMARQFLEQSLSGNYPHWSMTADRKQRAKKMLDELKDEE